ncbi:MAG: hypothetical protein ACKKL6_00655 [Candidatus Komeilibacteria bacterium]
MELNLTRRQMMIIGIVVLLLVIIVVALTMFNKESAVQDEFVPQVYDSNNMNTDVEIKADVKLDEKEYLATAVARNFVARFLSYSNENWGENIAVLEPQMTEGMMQYAQQDLIKLKNEYPTDEFYGVSAKALSQKIVNEQDNGYSIEVSVQLQKTIGNTEEIEYKKYEVGLVASGDSWLINSLYLIE